MKRILLLGLSYVDLTETKAQEITNYKEKRPYKSRIKIDPKQDDIFFKTLEAVYLINNVQLYQQTIGDWPKNNYMPAEVILQKLEDVLYAKIVFPTLHN